MVHRKGGRKRRAAGKRSKPSTKPHRVARRLKRRAKRSKKMAKKSNKATFTKTGVVKSHHGGGKPAVVPMLLAGETINSGKTLERYLFSKAPFRALHATGYLPSVQSVKHNLTESMPTRYFIDDGAGQSFQFLKAIPMTSLKNAGQGNTFVEGYTKFNAEYDHYIVTQCDWRVHISNFYSNLGGATDFQDVYIAWWYSETEGSQSLANTLEEIRATLGQTGGNDFSKMTLHGMPVRSATLHRLHLVKLPLPKQAIAQPTGGVQEAYLTPGRVTLKDTFMLKGFPSHNIQLDSKPEYMTKWMSNKDLDPVNEIFLNIAAVSGEDFSNNSVLATELTFRSQSHAIWWEPSVAEFALIPQETTEPA